MSEYLITAIMIVFMMFTPHHQNPDLDALWLEVKELDQKGLYQSALKKVQEIKRLAIDYELGTHRLKSTLYMAKYNGLLSENDIEKSITDLRNELNDEVSVVNQSIIHSYVADLYLNLSMRDHSSFNSQKWKEKALKHSLLSVKFLDSCYLPLEDIKIIVESSNHSILDSEFLSDLLFRKSLKILQSEHQSQLLIRPDFIFTNPNRFTRIKIEDDVTGLYQLMQNYELLLLKNNAKISLAEQYFNRLSLTELDSTRIRELQEFIDWTNDERIHIRALCRFEQAFDQYAWCKRYYKNESLPPYEQKLILQTLQHIENPYTQVQMEEVYPSNAPVVLGINQKMVKKVEIELRKLNPIGFRKLWYDRNNQDLYFSEGEIVFSGQMNPKSSNFYYVLPDLNHGQYLLRISALSTDSLVLDPKLRSEYIPFQVSDLSLVNRDHEVYYVLNRQNGVHLRNVEINIYEANRDKTGNSKSIYSDKTNEEGIFKNPFRKNYQSKGLWLKLNEDILIVPHVYFYKHSSNTFAKNKAQVFTDRAIYRPGDQIHLSGFITEVNYPSGIHHLVLKQKPVSVELVNTQGQILDKLELTIDNFGSFQGDFKLSDKILPGSFSLRVNGTHAVNIQVEEYKAPKISIELSQSSTEEDSILVQGFVGAIAGYPITNATIDYIVRIERKLWRYNSNWIPGNTDSESRTILDGKSNTSREGTFQFKWKKVDVSSHYHMHYVVEVKARDENGEIVQTVLSIPLNKKSISINWGSLEPQIDISSLESTKIAFKNIEGKSITLDDVQWEIHQLNSDNYDNIQAYFGQIDESLIIGESRDIERVLSYYKIKSDTLPSKLIKRDLLRSDGVVPLVQCIQRSGIYELKVYTNEQEFSYTLHIQSVEEGFRTDENPLIYLFSKTQALPGETINLSLNTHKEEHIPIRMLISQNGIILKESLHEVNDLTHIPIYIEESYRGNIHIVIFYVYKGRYHYVKQRIDVPFENKKLHVEYLKWPKNAEPDAEEKIILQVKDEFGRPVETQFAVSIYDKRLDEIKEHNWTAQYYPNYKRSFRLDQYQFNLTSAYSRIVPYPRINIPYAHSLLENIFNVYDHRMYMPVMEMAYSDTKRTKSRNETSNLNANQENEEYFISEPSKVDLAEGGSNIPKNLTALRNDLSALMYFNGKIKTNKDGIAEISFRTNDAISDWAVLLHGHTQDLSFHVGKESFKTFKSLLIEPNLPRFVHEGDEMLLTTKIVNRTENEITVMPSSFYLVSNLDTFIELEILEGDELHIPPYSSHSFKSKLKVPAGSDKLTLRFSASSDQLFDAIEKDIPIRSNKVYQVESIPISTFQGNSTWDHQSIEELINNQDIDIESIAFEYTAHEYIPMLIALTGTFEEEERFSMEVFDKWQAFTLVSQILKQAPELREIIQGMKMRNVPINPMSDLENFRIVDISQTKWARAGEKTSAELYRQLEFLLNDRLRESESHRLWLLIKSLQNNDGGIKWSSDSRFSSFNSSLDLAENYLRLYRLGIIKLDRVFVSNLLEFISNSFLEIELDVERDIMAYDRQWIAYGLFTQDIHDDNVNLWNPKKLIDSVKHKFMDYPVGIQARLGLYLMKEDIDLVDTIHQSFEERSFYDPKVGRFWNHDGGWRWGEWQLNAHSYLLEFFNRREQKDQWMIEMKQWLVSHKQGNAWKNARQTSDALLSFYMTESSQTVDWELIISYGEERFSSSFPYYFTDSMNMDDLLSFELNNPSDYGYGCFLIKYKANVQSVQDGFKNLPLTLDVKYRKVHDDSLERISPMNIRMGDKLRVELELHATRPMDYLVILHNRSSGFEPLNALSGYHGFPAPHYSANYADHQAIFIEHISRGTHQYEYEFFVEQQGVLNSGISQIQSMYAPEFVNHTTNTTFEIRSYE